MNNQSGLDEIYDRLNKSIDRISEALSNLQSQKAATVKKSTATTMSDLAKSMSAAIESELTAKGLTLSKTDVQHVESDVVTKTVHANLRDGELMRMLAQGYTLTSEMPNQFNNVLVDLVFKRVGNTATTRTSVLPNPFNGGNR